MDTLQQLLALTFSYIGMAWSWASAPLWILLLLVIAITAWKSGHRTLGVLGFALVVMQTAARLMLVPWGGTYRDGSSLIAIGSTLSLLCSISDWAFIAAYWFVSSACASRRK